MVGEEQLQHQILVQTLLTPVKATQLKSGSLGLLWMDRLKPLAVCIKEITAGWSNSTKNNEGEGGQSQMRENTSAGREVQIRFNRFLFKVPMYKIEQLPVSSSSSWLASRRLSEYIFLISVFCPLQLVG